MTNMKSIPAMSFKRMCALKALSNDNGQRTRFFESLVCLEILSLNICKNVQYYWKSCLRDRRNWALNVLFQVCILKKSNYTHISSFVRTKNVNSYVIWVCIFKVGAGCYKSKYVKIKC